MLLDTPAPIETGPLRLDDVPVPEPGPDEVRIQVHACGVCRTDLHVVEGDLEARRSPIIPGQNNSGIKAASVVAVDAVIGQAMRLAASV